MRQPTTAADLGVYVHIPFCERVCPYCDFAVEGVRRLSSDRETSHVDLLLRELELSWAALEPQLEDRRLATVYFGGGTPSLLSGASVERLLTAIRARFRGEPLEVTLELNPGALEIRRLPEFRAAGVTRLSVGVQSLRDGPLKRLGRAQRASETLRGLEACASAGFATLSADLIMGAPEEREAELLADLDRIIELGIPHLSAYALTIEANTPFATAHARAQLALPDEDQALQTSLLLRARLAAAGYRHYEISSYAQPGHHSRHNERYWLRRDVLGLGVSAATLLGDLRFQNHRAVADWERAVALGERPVDELERLSRIQAMRETLYLGFRRLAGVSRAEYRDVFGESPEDRFEAEIHELLELELIRDQAGQLSLTERGILFADEVFLRFVGR